MAKAPNGKAPTRFLRSVNVERDHADGDALSGYLLTSGGTRVLQRITSESAGRAWTLTGPYGTGKSAFCVFALQLLAPPGFPGHARALGVLRNEGLEDATSAQRPARARAQDGSHRSRANPHSATIRSK